MRWLVPTVLVIAVVLAACGGGASHSTHSTHSTSPPAPVAGRLSIQPPAPTTRSRVTFAFTAPATAGHHGSSQLSFVLTLAGPRHMGCLGAQIAPVPRAIKGQTASLVLGGGWCPGTYAARVQEFARPSCRPGQMCPQYVRLVATVATTSFRIAPA